VTSEDKRIQSWSTREVPPDKRIDFWMSTLRTAMWPVSRWSAVAEDFGVELNEAALGALGTLRMKIGAHVSHRSRHDLDRCQDPHYLLFTSFGTEWGSGHNGHCERLRPHDLVLWADAELDSYVPYGLDGVVLRIPAPWLKTWLPDPQQLVGRRIEFDSEWGRVLSPMVCQMTPELAVSSPIPHELIADQFGAVLALLAGDVQARALPDMLKRIQECIRARCAEPALTASAVAAALAIEPADLHRALGSRKLTFAALLDDCRVTRALELLHASGFSPAALEAVAQRCGYADSARLARAIRRRTGRALNMQTSRGRPRDLKGPLDG